MATIDPSHDANATKPSLLLRIRDTGDVSSWGDFAEVYGPIIRGYCQRRHLQEADASDIAQEVLAQVARSIGAFDYEPGRGRFRDWLGTITRNKIARFFEALDRSPRPAGGNQPSGFEAIDPNGDDLEWTAEFHANILQTALARIRADFAATTWAAFQRVWCDDQPALDVAHELGQTIDSVYAAKSRVLRRLREEVLSLAEDLPLLAPRP